VCTSLPAAILCAPAACSGPTSVTGASFCNGAGTCVPGPTADCSPLTCVAGACVTP
jgi:hypothetical protein